MPAAHNIADLRAAARRRLPRLIYDYVDGGSWDEQTLGENSSDFRRIELIQRVLVDVSTRDLSTTVLGQQMKLPLIIAPTGFAGLVARDGEIKGARAAAAAGIPFCQSTVSINSLEEVRAAVPQPQWMQLYVWKERPMAQRIIDRARAAGCEVLVFTVDTVIQGKREKDLRTGFFTAGKITPSIALDFALHPLWTLEMANGPRPQFGNLKGLPGAGDDILNQAYFAARQQDQSLTWDDLTWLRNQWSGKLVVKGILGPDDARRAVDRGADGIVVSNHGGRQLDGASSTIRALPEIARAVGDQVDVLLDSGIRRGQDVVKALALGAKACMIGRAWLYGLAAGGEAGVRQAIDILGSEMETTMALMGAARLTELRGNAEVVRPRF